MDLTEYDVLNVQRFLREAEIVARGDIREIEALRLPDDWMIVWEMHGDPRSMPRVESTIVPLGKTKTMALVERRTLHDGVVYRASIKPPTGELRDVQRWTEIEVAS